MNAAAVALLGGLTILGVASARRAARVRGARRARRGGHEPGATRWTIQSKGPLLALLMLAGARPPGAMGLETVIALLIVAVITGLTLLTLVYAPYLPWYFARGVAIPLGLPRVAYPSRARGRCRGSRIPQAARRWWPRSRCSARRATTRRRPAGSSGAWRASRSSRRPA
ncbi:MAG: hypothetical protein H6713_36270 [Myxococcales bacterium]|nr:hypothetical protein [Myxococcales bacterium]